MKKIKVLLLTFLSVFLLTSVASALPSDLYDITGIDGTQGETDQGYQAFSLIDTDLTGDTATAFLLLEIAGFKDDNIFGIYGYTDDGSGNITLGETLDIFQGSASAISSATLEFDVSAGTVSLRGGTTSAFISADHFGFYISTPQNNTFYTQTVLNADGADHAMAFDTSDNGASGLLGSDIVIAFEDLLQPSLSEPIPSFDDMVVGIIDIKPVPEPATLMLFGLGLLSVAGITRRKRS